MPPSRSADRAPNAGHVEPARREGRGRGHLVTAFAHPGFTRLVVARLAGQFGDGVFQASLAGAVLFSPERQAAPSDIAAGFAVLLLPYSLIGPFTGVLLDRWWRQRVLVGSNLVRAVLVLGLSAEIAAGVHGVPFYASALVILSISRFFLSALSAAQPHVLDAPELVTGNALTTTLGTVATAVGGAAAIGVRLATGGSPHDYAAIALSAAVPYLISAAVSVRFGRERLGPTADERRDRERIGDVARGLAAGGRHLVARPPALLALGVIGVHRLCFGVWTVCTVLLFRGYFHADGVLRAGLTGLGQLVIVAAIGGGLAALVTPSVSRRIGSVPWMALLLVAAGIVEVACGLPYLLWPAMLAGALLGFASQGIKICVDTTIQQRVDDAFRGRIFALYDGLFNLALVLAAALTAAVLPADGRAPVAVVVIGVVYLATAAGYAFIAPRVSSGAARTTP